MFTVPTINCHACGHSLPVLTANQRSILELVAQGFTNKEIAAALRIHLTTVKNSITLVNQRLNTSDRSQAVMVAAALGYIDLQEMVRLAAIHVGHEPQAITV